VSRGAQHVLASLLAAACAGVIVTFFVWRWQRRVGLSFVRLVAPGGLTSGTVLWTLAAVLIGVALGAVAHVYTDIAMGLMSDESRSALLSARETMRASAMGMTWFAALAIAVAPLTEEFLFRGLLFRALASRTPLALAVVASAACFAVVHPMLSWLPVFVLGIVCALVFHRSRHLLPVIVLHAVYNALVVFAVF
jgi:ABC-2 type transport system permease protein